jgi:hypothetical protein
MWQCGGVVGFVDGKSGSNNTLECFGRWENCTVEGTLFEGGSFEYEILGDFFVRS